MAISPNPTVSAVATSTLAPHSAAVKPTSSNSTPTRPVQQPQPQSNGTQAPTDTVNISANAISALQQSRQTPSQAIEQIDRSGIKSPNT